MSVLALACVAPDPPRPQDVEDALFEMVAAVESQQPGIILDHIHPEFVSSDGLDYADVDAVLMKYLFHKNSLYAELLHADVDPPNADGERHVRAEVTFTQDDRQLRYRFDLVFRQIINRWQVMRGGYERLDASPTIPTT